MAYFKNYFYLAVCKKIQFLIKRTEFQYKTSNMTCTSFPENYPMSLWEDIFKVHWNYLETEENMQKLEKRKNLEGK